MSKNCTSRLNNDYESTFSKEKPLDGEAKADIEAQAQSGHSSQRSTSADTPAKDPNLVTWSGPDDPANPKNWPIKKKWGATFAVSFFTLISLVCSSMIATAVPQMSRDLGIKSAVEGEIALSVFILAYAVGPLLLGPLSEIYGRVRVLQLGNLFFFAWNLGCGFAQTPGQMIAFRFLSGLGGSAALPAAGGVLSDCWLPHQRGKAVGVYSLAPLLGPILGPIAGGFIAENITWRWVFWSTCIADAVIQISGLFLLQESYAPVLLEQKAKLLRQSTGNMDLHTGEDSSVGFVDKLKTALVRPFRMITTQPIIQVIALYMAFIFGLNYLILATFSDVFRGVYGESVQISGLNYLSLGIGCFIGLALCANVNDAIYQRLKHRNNGIGQPEFRVPPMMFASPLTAVGLFWYGWSAQEHVHWIMPNIGMAIFGVGTIVCMQCMQIYVFDCYARFAASGMAAVVVLRSIAGFGFPLFAPYMYDALGYGWGTSVLAFAGIAIGIPAPFLFWFYGEKLRSRSTYAAGG